MYSWLEQAGAVGVVAALDLGQSADQPLDLLRAVADGKVGQDVADVAELDLDVVLIAQDVVDLDAGKDRCPACGR